MANPPHGATDVDRQLWFSPPDSQETRRRALTRRYEAALAPLAPTVRIAARPPWSDPALHLLTVLIDFAAAGRARAQVMAALKAKGVGSQVHYIPVHRQPYYTARYGLADLPGARHKHDPRVGERFQHESRSPAGQQLSHNWPPVLRIWSRSCAQMAKPW